MITKKNLHIAIGVASITAFMVLASNTNDYLVGSVAALLWQFTS